MSVRRVVLAALLGCAVAWPGAHAQTAPRKPAAGPAQRQVDDAAFRGMIGEAEQALQKGDYPSTLAAAERAVAEGSRVFGADHPNTAAAYNLIAAAFLRQGKFGEA